MEETVMIKIFTFRKTFRDLAVGDHFTFIEPEYAEPEDEAIKVTAHEYVYLRGKSLQVGKSYTPVYRFKVRDK
jgi:hypothetical protein